MFDPYRHAPYSGNGNTPTEGGDTFALIFVIALIVLIGYLTSFQAVIIGIAILTVLGLILQGFEKAKVYIKDKIPEHVRDKITFAFFCGALAVMIPFTVYVWVVH